MKTILFVASLSAALFALPASAQQGPAGIPGLTGLVSAATASVTTPPPAPQAAPAQTKRTPADCSKAKDPALCKARDEARKTALEACKDTKGKAHQECMQQKKKAVDCSVAQDPARCTQHQKARELCKDKPAAEHRQCLRDNLAPRK